jgi:putative RNA 2'-phosphotransferase
MTWSVLPLLAFQGKIKKNQQLSPFLPSPKDKNGSMPRKTVNDRTSLEKLLRYVLGIAPNEFGLVAGEGGYVPMKDLLAAIKDEGGFRGASESRIMELVNVPGGKSPFETEGNLIRLKPESASLPPPVPEGQKLPKELYAALKPSTWPAASQNGLMPRRPKENAVPLFTDKDMAFKVAKRFCPDPVPIRIQASKAKADGVVFTPYGDNIFLCDYVPQNFLIGPVVKPQEEKDIKKTSPPSESRTTDYSVQELMVEPVIHKGKKKGKYSDEPDWKVRTRKDRRGKNEP